MFNICLTLVYEIQRLMSLDDKVRNGNFLKFFRIPPSGCIKLIVKEIFLY